ncbi:MAG: SOS response-associated peptidase [Coprococcus sp.]|nr:SOS response-associated peptidase [Coprococcus sp.]
MCGRYYVDRDMEDELEKVIHEIDRKMREECQGRDVYPTNRAPVIENTANGLGLSIQKWGYPAPQGKGVIINARSESVLDRPMFRQGIRYHRIVIPARGFYEWNREKEKSTFTRFDSPLMYMAGFYDRFENESRFVILTTEANGSMIKVHDRMPLILEENQLEQWFDGDRMEEILRQTPTLLQRTVEYEQQSLF